MIERVNTADIRRDLSGHLKKVAATNRKIILWRYGTPIGALVSMHDFRRIIDDEEEEKWGPKDSETGRRQGNSLITVDNPDSNAPDRWQKRYAKKRRKARKARRKQRYEARKAAEAERLAEGEAGRRPGVVRWMVGLVWG